MDGGPLVLPQEVAALVRSLLRAAEQLAQVDPADVPAALAVDLVAEVGRSAALADAATALLARRVETGGAWQESGARSSSTWLARALGTSHGHAVALLGATRIAERHPAFEPGLRSGAVTVRHLDVVRRALGGHGVRASERNRCFPSFAESLAAVAERTDPVEFGRVMKEWTDAVDHSPSGVELDAIESRFLTFTELDGVCHITGSMPLLEGRLLKRRLEAIVDSHFRDPAASALAGLRLGRGPDAGPDASSRRDRTRRRGSAQHAATSTSPVPPGRSSPADPH